MWTDENTLKVTPTRPKEVKERAVDVVAVPLSLHHKVDQPEVAALDDQRAAGGGQGQLLHCGYVVVQDLQRSEGKGGGVQNMLLG